MLPWSLHSMAGAPRTARRKKPATPVGMTEFGKGEEEEGTNYRAPTSGACASGARGNGEGGGNGGPVENLGGGWAHQRGQRLVYRP
jgi:hypothetical protein